MPRMRMPTDPFKSHKRFWTTSADLGAVAARVTEHFQAKGYQVAAVETGTGAWDIDITKVGVFRSVSGLRTALKVRIEPQDDSVVARAGIGILGQQVLPAAIALLVFWPVIVTQVWGAVQASRLDDEALAVIESALAPPPTAPVMPAAITPVAPIMPATPIVPMMPAVPPMIADAAAATVRIEPPAADTCGNCGAARGAGKFCVHCGQAL